jgi:sortase (surface protein transpeptidase)
MNAEREKLIALIKKTLGGEANKNATKKEKEAEIKNKTCNNKEKKKEEKEEETKKNAAQHSAIQLYAATRVEIPSLSRAIIWTTATTQGMDARKTWVTEANDSTPPT